MELLQFITSFPIRSLRKMEAWNLYLHLFLVVIFLSAIFGQMEDESEEDWLDPTDMLRYERGKMRPVKTVPMQPVNTVPIYLPQKDHAEESDRNEIPIDLNTQYTENDKDHLLPEAKEELFNEKKSDHPPKKPSQDMVDIRIGSKDCACTATSKEGAFFKQFVSSLLRQFPNDQGSSGVYQIITTLTPEDFAALEKFSASQGGLEDAHDVLIRIIQDVSRTDLPKYTLLQKIEKRLGFDFGSLVQISIAIFLCAISLILLLRLHLNISLSKLLFKMFVLLFFVSVPWNWWYLYKVAVAKREADMLKTVPEECRPQDMSATKSILAWVQSTFTFDQDECTKYHERMLVDPMWEVPPTQALAVTVTKFFLEPFKHIGQAFSELVKGLLEGMPVQLWPIVLILFSFFALFFLLMQANYRISVFWNLFGLEPMALQSAPPPSASSQGQNMILAGEAGAGAGGAGYQGNQSERQMIEEQPPPPPRPTQLPTPQPSQVASQTNLPSERSVASQSEHSMHQSDSSVQDIYNINRDGVQNIPQRDDTPTTTTTTSTPMTISPAEEVRGASSSSEKVGVAPPRDKVLNADTVHRVHLGPQGDTASASFPEVDVITEGFTFIPEDEDEDGDSLLPFAVPEQTPPHNVIINNTNRNQEVENAPLGQEASLPTILSDATVNPLNIGAMERDALSQRPGVEDVQLI